MRIALFVVVMSITAAACQQAEKEGTPDLASLRTPPAGEVMGFAGSYNSHAWLGIPYAEAPVGELRWRAPQPKAPWPGTDRALRFSSGCTQIASALGGVSNVRAGQVAGSEDCLYLNVWAPQFPPELIPQGKRRLPVMLWIHGGGNTIGHAGFYNGGNLAASQNVIVVSLNYRLGPFGWLRHEALRAAALGPEERSGNFGTLDLIAALRWVQKNIAAFGGDPRRVTVFGESAGGVNIFSLLVSPKAKGLFHRAIIQSGGPWMDDVDYAENFVDDDVPGHSSSSNESLLRMLIADEVATDRESAKAHLLKMSDEAIAASLRYQSKEEVLRAFANDETDGLVEIPKVFREGTVIPKQSLLKRLRRKSTYNAVPIILGTNRDENKLFMARDSRWVRNFLGLIPQVREPQSYNLVAGYLARAWKAQGVDQPAIQMRKTQGRSVYAYRFDWDEEPTRFGADLSMIVGAAHGFEIPFVFGHFDLGKEGNIIFDQANERGRLVLSEQMMSYWAEFAYRGDPGRGRDGSLPKWGAWSNRKDGDKTMILDTKAGGGLRMSKGVLSEAAVLHGVDIDPRLPTQVLKCGVYRELTLETELLDEKSYPSAGSWGCKEYPLDEYPWES